MTDLPINDNRQSQGEAETYDPALTDFFKTICGKTSDEKIQLLEQMIDLCKNLLNHLNNERTQEDEDT